MNSIVRIKGLTNYTINLDPSVWIFDKRKINLEHYLQTGEQITVEEREVSGSYGIPFEPFLKNAEPMPEAKHVICHQANGHEHSLTLDQAMNAILAFSKDGKALVQDGPIQLYITGADNTLPPITQIESFELTE